MTTRSTVIGIFSINTLLLVASGVFTFMIFQTLTRIAEMEQKNEMIIQQPYLSEDTRTEQKELLERSQALSRTFVQDPDKSIELIQEIEALAVDSEIDLEVHLDEKNQQPVGNLSLVPIEFEGSGPWAGVVAFQRALRETKPGFFLDEIALTNQAGDAVHFTLNYTLIWQGNL